jgi:hypothetical protein
MKRAYKEVSTVINGERFNFVASGKAQLASLLRRCSKSKWFGEEERKAAQELAEKKAWRD